MAVGGRRLLRAIALLTPLAVAGCGDSTDADDARAPIAETPAIAADAAPAVTDLPEALAAAPEPPTVPAPAPVVEAAPPAIEEHAPAEAPAAVDAPTPPVAAEAPPFRAGLPAADPPAAVAGPIPAPAPPANAAAIIDPALLARIATADPAAGERLAQQCGFCHALTDGARATIGPNLYDIVNAAIGRAATFPYSAPMRGLGAGGDAWTYDRLDAFIADPAGFLPGTTMAITGIADQRDRADLIAYLRILSPTPAPLPPGRIGQMVDGLDAVFFTAEQAAIGRFQYRVCAPCHHESLLGEWQGSRIGYAPPMAGEWFANRWFGRSVGAFVAAFRAVFLPDHDGPEDHGNFPPETYAALVAYVLEHNGFAPGDTPLPADPDAIARLGFWQ